MHSTYDDLVRILRTGAKLPQPVIDGILGGSCRSHRDLVRDLHAGPASEMPEECEKCGGELGVYSSRRRKTVVIQYLECRDCGARPEHNRRTIPAALVTRRKRNRSS